MKIKSISKSGLILIWFSEPVIVPADLKIPSDPVSRKRVLSIAIDKALEVNVIPGVESNLSKLNYTWSV
jgi:hypothetical protein